MIHMQCQVLFSLKSNEKHLECCLLQSCLVLSGLAFEYSIYVELLFMHNEGKTMKVCSNASYLESYDDSYPFQLLVILR